MTVDDDEVRAMENRLRTNGWANKPEPYFQSSRVRPSRTSLMPIEAKIRQVARWIAHESRGSWPTYQWVAGEFELSYDDAVLAVSEAKRLVGNE